MKANNKFNRMDILLYKKTKTSQFIMPLLFNKTLSEIITDFNSFEGAYIADFDKPNYDNKIILVFNKRQKNLPELNRVDKYTKTIKDSKEHFIYVYDLPTEFEDDYASFLIGRYSHLSEQAKQKILTFWNADDTTLLYGVLYKTGDAIKKYWKENHNTIIDEVHSDPEKEWWVDPTLSKEIYGTE